MSLTIGGGPLATDRPETVNYAIDGPQHLLYAHPFPRRIRAELAGKTVLKSNRGILVHESNLPPVLYVPFEDLAVAQLKPSEHRTHCPFKGDASYWSLHVADKESADAVWAYENPTPAASWLRGMAAMYWNAPDAWYDEAERVHGHLRDPFHRVDARETTDLVRVDWEGTTVALTGQAKVLSETGLANRHYIPFEDVQAELVPSRKRRHCPYKGEATYWTVRVGGSELPDAAWSFPTPLKDGQDVARHVCFGDPELTTTVEPSP
ncbi:DUF427 domain-containing protein [Spiractinospora alimapuensis]|uniref:DUF427 domain-containing protein n=1 Tax=Spiractinospora alimapuensis TaxID=2820884 RepID=UPI001F1A3730|nr:DUF427 domain-containing protein [Spiractinospora alimapuensis]QVQ50460.1 DUF427 domain-containing protein [Spiractinospora alimapuensis]